MPDDITFLIDANVGRTVKGVIRLEDTLPHVHVQYLRTLLRQHREELIDHVVVAESGRIRIRRK